MPIFERPVIELRRKNAAEALGNSGPVVLIAAGEPLPKPGGLDQTYPFLPLPEYYWLSGSRRSGGVLAYEPGQGWTHFVRQADAAELLWEGVPEVPEGEDVAGLGDWLKSRSGKPVVRLGGPAAGQAAAPVNDPALAAAVREKLDRVRRIKDSAEIALVETTAAATAAGFRRAREVIRPGVTERQVQVELEAEMRRHGADGTSFGTIVGAGTHSAVLHFEPGARIVGEKDLVLVDSGAEVHEYSADVTRTFPASSSFTPEQQAVYDLVLAAQAAAIAQCRPGTEWHSVHRAAAAVMAEGLKHLGLLKGSTDSLLDTGAIALFFPHGVGHMLGLRVRDVGGTLPGRPEGRLCCGARVRVDMPLEAGFLMTVEPGLYFVPAMLDDAGRRAQFKDAVAWEALERWLPVGGVRIEDDILITARGPKNLTEAIPK
ncbi:MAG TPA: aminopeptidase P family protein [Elusimicrobiales bacterium]|nr:aminopeptidase P family protein [Elusimicrobiales bacterium]